MGATGTGTIRRTGAAFTLGCHSGPAWIVGATSACRTPVGITGGTRLAVLAESPLAPRRVPVLLAGAAVAQHALAAAPSLPGVPAPQAPEVPPPAPTGAPARPGPVASPQVLHGVLVPRTWALLAPHVLPPAPYGGWAPRAGVGVHAPLAVGARGAAETHGDAYVGVRCRGSGREGWVGMVLVKVVVHRGMPHREEVMVVVMMMVRVPKG